MIKDCDLSKKSQPADKSTKDTDSVSLYVESNVNEHDEALQTNKESNCGTWCFDSDCTSHMCNDVGVFKDINSCERGKLKLANDACAEIEAKGTVSFTANVKGTDKTVRFLDMLYVPDFRTNLISVSRITDKGHSVIFDKDQASVIDNVVLIAERVNGLYYVRGRNDECRAVTESDVTTRVQKPKINPLEDWHVRLGHLNLQSLREAMKSGAIRGISIKDVSDISKDFTCEVCLQGKMSRRPFPKKSERESNLGDLIHSDICGPMRVISNGKSRYFMTFIDDHSGWCKVRFIEHKNQALKEFENFRARVETQQGKKIKVI